MKAELALMNPEALSDVKKIQDSLNIHKHQRDGSHPKILGFHEHFKQLRIEDSDPAFSKAIIDLPFHVKAKFLSFLRAKDQDRCCFIDVDLIAAGTDDCLECDKGDEDFEEIYV